jgi:hypothetical protein
MKPVQYFDQRLALVLPITTDYALLFGSLDIVQNEVKQQSWPRNLNYVRLFSK